MLHFFLQSLLMCFFISSLSLITVNHYLKLVTSHKICLTAEKVNRQEQRFKGTICNISAFRYINTTRPMLYILFPWVLRVSQMFVTTAKLRDIRNFKLQRYGQFCQVLTASFPLNHWHGKHRNRE